MSTCSTCSYLTHGGMFAQKRWEGMRGIPTKKYMDEAEEEDFVSQGFHVLSVSDGCSRLLTVSYQGHQASSDQFPWQQSAKPQPFSYLYPWWLSLTLIRVIYMELFLKLKLVPFACSQKDRDNAVFPSFPWPSLCPLQGCILDPVSCFKQMPVVDFDLFSPPPSSCSRSVYRACAGGAVWVCVCVCMRFYMCGDDVSFTVWVKTDVQKTDCVMSTDTVKRNTVLRSTKPIQFVSSH